MADSNQQAGSPRSPTVWRAVWPDRLFMTLGMWGVLLLGSAWTVTTILHGSAHWREAILTAALTAGAVLLGRMWVVEAVLDGEVLRVRRLLPGRAETLPLSRIRSAQHSSRFAPPLPYGLMLRFGTLASVSLRGYAYPRAQREAWAALMADLRQALGDRWRE